MGEHYAYMYAGELYAYMCAPELYARGRNPPPIELLESLQSQEQRLDLIVREQYLFIATFLRGEHNWATGDLRQLVPPHVDAVSEEVGFDGVDRGHGSGRLGLLQCRV